MYEVGLRVIPYASPAHQERRIADLCAWHSGYPDVDSLGFHMLAMLGNAMAMLAQVIVAPRSAVAAHNINLPIGVSQLDQQIVKKIKLLHVIVLHIAGAVVAKEMVQLCDAIGKIPVPYAVNDIDTFTRMKVVETQPVVREVSAQADCCAREDTQQT